MANARFYRPFGLALDDTTHLLYVADSSNSLIREIDLNKDPAVVTTIAGNGSGVSRELASQSPSNRVVADTATRLELSLNPSDDMGPVLATEFGLLEPEGVAVDPFNRSLFIADSVSRRIVIMDLDTEMISVFAGGNDVSDEPYQQGDYGVATQATFNLPINVALSPTFGHLFVLDFEAHRARRINRGDGKIYPAAGSLGEADNCTWNSGDKALDYQFFYPGAMVVGPDGVLYIADTEKRVIMSFIP